MPTLNKPSRRNYQPPNPARKPTGDQSFYNTKQWRLTTKRYRQQHPLCEVSEAIDRVAAAQVTDHIVAREFGGSDFDPRNLMGMTKDWHDKKSGIESHGAFVRTIMTVNGLVPEDRQHVIDRLTRPTGGGSEQIG